MVKPSSVNRITRIFWESLLGILSVSVAEGSQYSEIGLQVWELDGQDLGLLVYSVFSSTNFPMKSAYGKKLRTVIGHSVRKSTGELTKVSFPQS